MYTSYGRLINFGSGAELNPSSPYGESKRDIRTGILKLDKCFNLRIFGIFDENEWETRFIKTSIRNHIANKPITIHQDKFFSFLYMEDLIKLVDYYITTNPTLLPKEYNCCYPLNFTLSEIAKIINDLQDHKVPVIVENEEFGGEYSGFNGENDLTYSLDMWGLSRGIRIVYNKLKEERYKEMDFILKQANDSSLGFPNDNTVSSTIENMTFMYLNTKQ
jgi:nucleoside-diphosphate-sugar epimerase